METVDVPIVTVATGSAKRKQSFQRKIKQPSGQPSTSENISNVEPCQPSTSNTVVSRSDKSEKAQGITDFDEDEPLTSKNPASSSNVEPNQPSTSSEIGNSTLGVSRKIKRTKRSTDSTPANEPATSENTLSSSTASGPLKDKKSTSGTANKLLLSRKEGDWECTDSPSSVDLSRSQDLSTSEVQTSTSGAPDTVMNARGNDFADQTSGDISSASGSMVSREKASGKVKLKKMTLKEARKQLVSGSARKESDSVTTFKTGNSTSVSSGIKKKANGAVESTPANELSSGNTLSSSVASRVGKSLLVKKAAGRSSTMSKKNARVGGERNLTPSDQPSVSVGSSENKKKASGSSGSNETAGPAAKRGRPKKNARVFTSVNGDQDQLTQSNQQSGSSAGHEAKRGRPKKKEEGVTSTTGNNQEQMPETSIEQPARQPIQPPQQLAPLNQPRPIQPNLAEPNLEVCFNFYFFLISTTW